MQPKASQLTYSLSLKTQLKHYLFQEVFSGKQWGHLALYILLLDPTHTGEICSSYDWSDLTAKTPALPGWEGSLGENGYMYTYGWVPSLFIWDLSQHCLLIGYHIRSDQLLSCVRLFATMNRSMPGLPVPGLIFRIIGYTPIQNKTFRKKIA